MTPTDCLAAIPDAELFVRVERLTARSNVALADLLVHLGEVERRGIHRERACASLYAYCMYELRMSEDAASRRAQAARLVRRYPELYMAIAKGEIHLTGVLMIGPHLGGERHGELLERARFRSKRELARIVAEMDPKPEVPSLVEPIGPALAGSATQGRFVQSLAAPVRELPAGRKPGDWIEGDTDGDASDGVSVTETLASHADDGESVAETLTPRAGDGVSLFETWATHMHGGASPSETPALRARGGESPSETSPQRAVRYRVQFTARQEFVDLLDEVRDLIGYKTPRPALPEIQVRALRALVKELRTRKRVALAREPDAQRTAPKREPDTERTAPEREPGTERVVPARERVTEHTAPEREPDTEYARAVPAPRPSPASPTRSSGAAQEGANARPRTRYVPARVRREVYARDGAICAYRDTRGQRCRETFGLEIHHRHAFALGGPHTLDNLELRCRAHNTLAAELDFGREYTDFSSKLG